MEIVSAVHHCHLVISQKSAWLTNLAFLFFKMKNSESKIKTGCLWGQTGQAVHLLWHELGLNSKWSTFKQGTRMHVPTPAVVADQLCSSHWYMLLTPKTWFYEPLNEPALFDWKTLWNWHFLAYCPTLPGVLSKQSDLSPLIYRAWNKVNQQEDKIGGFSMSFCYTVPFGNSSVCPETPK